MVLCTTTTEPRRSAEDPGAVGSQEDSLDLGVIHHGDQNDVAGLADLLHGAGGRRPEGHGLLDWTLLKVEDRQRVIGASHVQGHRQPHCAKPDETDPLSALVALFRVHLCIHPSRSVTRHVLVRPSVDS